MKPIDFKSEVVEIKKISEECIFLTITSPPKFSFEPGQFITFMFRKDGKNNPRSYSVLDFENNQIKLCIGLIPGGFASGIFSRMKEGDQLDIKGPLGRFVFDENIPTPEIWFLGGGTGIVPLYCLVKNNLSKFPDKKMAVIFSSGNKSGLYLNSEFKKLAEKYPNFQYIPTLTRKNWSGKTGRIQTVLPKKLKNKTFYICGAKELVLDVKKHLLDNGVDVKNIKFERFT